MKTCYTDIRNDSEMTSVKKLFKFSRLNLPSYIDYNYVVVLLRQPCDYMEETLDFDETVVLSRLSITLVLSF